MSAFNDMLAADAVNVFANPTEFGESGTFTPRGGTPRTIGAVVDRNPPERINARGEFVTPKMTITVANDATTGISSADLDAYGNDKFAIPLRIGGVAQVFGVYLPDSSAGNFMDAGMITLDLK
jgi:hypothetical protein